MIKGVAHKARGLCEKVLCVLIIQHKLFKRFLTAAMHTKFEPVWSTQTCFWDKDFGSIHHQRRNLPAPRSTDSSSAPNSFYIQHSSLSLASWKWNWDAHLALCHRWMMKNVWLKRISSPPTKRPIGFFLWHMDVRISGAVVIEVFSFQLISPTLSHYLNLWKA